MDKIDNPEKKQQSKMLPHRQENTRVSENVGHFRIQWSQLSTVMFTTSNYEHRVSFESGER